MLQQRWSKYYFLPRTINLIDVVTSMSHRQNRTGSHAILTFVVMFIMYISDKAVRTISLTRCRVLESVRPSVRPSIRPVCVLVSLCEWLVSIRRQTVILLVHSCDHHKRGMIAHRWPHGPCFFPSFGVVDWLDCLFVRWTAAGDRKTFLFFQNDDINHIRRKIQNDPDIYFYFESNISNITAITRWQLRIIYISLAVIWRLITQEFS